MICQLFTNRNFPQANKKVSLAILQLERHTSRSPMHIVIPATLWVLAFVSLNASLIKYSRCRIVLCKENLHLMWIYTLPKNHDGAAISRSSFYSQKHNPKKAIMKKCCSANLQLSLRQPILQPNAGLPEFAITRLGSTAFFHDWRISCVKFLSKKTNLVVASKDIHIWDTKSGARHKRIVFKNSSYATSVCPISDKGIIVGYMSGVVCVWNLANSNKLLEIQAHSSPVRFVFCTDDKKRAVTYDGSHIKIWNGSTGKLTRSIAVDTYQISSLAISPDGKNLVCIGRPHLLGQKIKNRLYFWDLFTGRQLKAMVLPAFDGFKNLEYSPNGKQLVLGAQGNSISVFDIESGKITHKLDIQQNENSDDSKKGALYVAFCPTGNRVVAWRQFSTRIIQWDIRANKTLEFITSGSPSFAGLSSLGVDYSPDGKLLAVGGQFGRVHLFRTDSGAEITPLEDSHSAPISLLEFVNNGELISGSNFETKAFVWDVRQRKILQRVYCPGVFGGSMDASRKGMNLARQGKDGSIRLWSKRNGKYNGTNLKQTGEIIALDISKDGRSLALRNCKQSLTLWNVATGKLIKTLRKSKGRKSTIVQSIVLSADGALLATSENDGSIHVWDVKKGMTHRRIEKYLDVVYALEFSPDSKLLVSANSDGKVRVWDVSTGRYLYSFAPELEYVSVLAFSPDGRTIAVGGHGKTVSLWETMSGKRRRVFRGHLDSITALAFSPDGRILASGSKDSTILIWNVLYHRRSRIAGLLQSSFQQAGYNRVRLDQFTKGALGTELLRRCRVTKVGLAKMVNGRRRPCWL